MMDEVLSIKCIPNNEEKYISFSLKFELKREWKWDQKKKNGKKFRKTRNSIFGFFQIHPGRIGKLVKNLLAKI